MVAKPITLSLSTADPEVRYERTAGSLLGVDLSHYPFLFNILAFCLHWPTIIDDGKDEVKTKRIVVHF